MRRVSSSFPCRRQSALASSRSSAGQDLRDNQIGAIDQRNRRATNVGSCRAIEKSVLEPRAGKHNIERHRRCAMHEGHDARATHEVRIGDAQLEAGACHVVREVSGRLRDHSQGHVDVGAQSWHTVGDHGLGAEEIPPPPPIEDRSHRREQFNGSGLDRHGGTVAPRGRETRGRWRGRLRQASRDADHEPVCAIRRRCARLRAGPAARRGPASRRPCCPGSPASRGTRIHGYRESTQQDCTPAESRFAWRLLEVNSELAVSSAHANSP